jgi:fatty acid desaturase
VSDRDRAAVSHCGGHAWARDHRIKQLYAPPRASAALAIVLGYAAGLVALPGVAAAAARLALTIACAFATASVLKGLNNIVHECSHQAFSTSRAFNDGVGTLLCIVLLTDYGSYKLEHASHHRHLGDYGRDLDFQLRRPLAHDRPFRWRRMVLDLVTLRFLWFYAPRIQLSQPHQRAGAAALALALTVLIALGWWHAALTLAMAHVVFMPLLRFLIDIVDHGGIYLVGEDELRKSRNFIVRNPVVRWLLFPRNDCYHLIHHLYPYLPVASFGAAHALLSDNPDYRALPHRATTWLWSRQSTQPVHWSQE